MKEDWRTPEESWKEVRSKRGEKRNSSTSEDSECVVRFGDQIRASKINLLKLTKVLNKAVENMDFAKVLQEGNFLIGCNIQRMKPVVNGIKRDSD